jgi:hypothetical protein
MSIYKIIAQSEVDTSIIADFIEKNNGSFVVLGSAIITDYVFKTTKYVKYVSKITDELSDFDIVAFNKAR